MHGMIEIVTPAWSMPQSVPPRLVCVRAAARITGSVNEDSRLGQPADYRVSDRAAVKADQTVQHDQPHQPFEKDGACDHTRSQRDGAPARDHSLPARTG